MCILVILKCFEQNRQVSGKGRIHLDGYVWTLDKPTASLFAAAALMTILLNLVNPILHELK